MSYPRLVWNMITHKRVYVLTIDMVNLTFQTSNSQGVKIILMSATLNADKLLHYYSWPVYVNGPLEQQGCKFDIPGTLNHDVAVFYLDDVS